MSWIDGVRHRVYTLLHRDDYAREQAEERRFHCEMEGLHGPVGAPSGGSRPAELPTPEAGRSLISRFLEPLNQDLAYAIRGLARSPGFTLVAVLTLALGVGANASVFSLLDRLFGQPPAGVSEPEGLRRLYIRLPDHPLEPGMVYPWFNYPALSAVDQAMSGGGEVAGWTPSSLRTIGFDETQRSVRASWVTHDYFTVLGVWAEHGRLFGPDETGVEVPRPVAVISHAFWERAFDLDPGVVGRTIELDSTAVTVIGVTEPGFAGLDLSYTDVFLHLSTFPARPGPHGLAWHEWTGGNYLRSVARLPHGEDGEPFEARATARYRRLLVEERGATIDSTATVLTGSVIEARGPGRAARPATERQAVSISVRAAGVSVILLLIACANVAGLLLVRAARRRREIAVRLALGISRGRLLSQLVTEGVVLAAVAAATSVVLAVWGAALLRRLLLPDVAWASTGVDARTVTIATTTALAMGLLAVLAPALASRRVEVGAGLKEGGDGRSPRSRARSVLLMSQAALSVVLLVGAGLFVRSLDNVAELRLGFDVEALARVDPGPAADSEGSSTRAEIASRLAALPGVAAAAIASSAPMMGYAINTVYLPGRDSLPEIPPGAYPAYVTVSPDFFDVAGMRVLEGRPFREGEAGVAVVSEAMSRTLWPVDGGLGRCFTMGERDAPCLEVVGVVEDSRRMDILEEETALQYFLPRGADARGGTVVLRVDPRRWSQVAEAVRWELSARFDPRRIRMGLMSEYLEPQLRPWRLGAQLFTAFGVLALLVTVVGVYSVMAYAVSQRTHEMGVRIALGAKLGDILRLVVGDGLRVVAVGIAVGGLVAVGAGRVVESLLYGVTPHDPVAVATAVGVLLATGAAASFVPAWRAGQVDPAETLRQE